MNRSLQCKQAWAVRKSVVRARSGVRIATLVKELQITRINLHGLVVGAADEVAVRDVVGPRSGTVGLPSKRCGLAIGLSGPSATETGSSERAEVATIVSLALDDHQVSRSQSRAFDGVNLYGLEKIRRVRFAQDRFVIRAERTRELANGHASAIDVAIVTCEKEVHILTTNLSIERLTPLMNWAIPVSNDRLIDGTRFRIDIAREERLSC